MPAERPILEFPPFRLDLQNERLWRDDTTIGLRPRTWRLMRFMVENPDRLLTKDELLEAVWGDVVVAPSSLNQAIRELRQALGDDARNPLLIETVHRRGFRFIGKPQAASPQFVARPPLAPSRVKDGDLGGGMFGRDQELARMCGLLDLASSGVRQVLFITGESGIGKTTLMRAFLEQIAEDGDTSILIGGGQCVDQHGEGEAYLPVLESIDHMTRGRLGAQVADALRRYAPTWLAQFPWLREPQDSTTAALPAGTPARMLRELCVALEALAAERSVVLWLEDLQWSDPATIDLLGAIARRPDPARLMVVGTYLPVEAALREHPVRSLKHSLMQQSTCHELALELLGDPAIEMYLARRFEGLDPSTELVDLFHRVSSGNPLFFISLADYVVDHGWLELDKTGWVLTTSLESIEKLAPESLRAIVEAQLIGMSADEVEALEAGSLIGETFSAQLIGAALDEAVDVVEAVCGQLSGWERVLEAAGTSAWPDGTVGQRFCLRHDAFRHILRDRVAPARRQILHLRIARRLEAAFENEIEDRAAEIAFHYERGGEASRAVEFFSLAAAGVSRRFAGRQAAAYLDRALELLTTLPDSEEHARRELSIRRSLARALILAFAYTAPEQRANAARIRDLAKQLGECEMELLGVAYQVNWHTLRGEVAAAHRLLDEARIISPDVDEPLLLLHAPVSSIMVYLIEGDLDRAESEFAQVQNFLGEIDSETLAIVLRHGNPIVLAHAFASWVAWLRGYPDEARSRAQFSRTQAAAVGDPFGLVVAADMSLSLERFCGDVDSAHALAALLASRLEEFGIEYPYAVAPSAEAWLMLQDGDIAPGISRLHDGLSAARASHALFASSLLFATVAELELARGAVDAGLAAIDEALEIVEEVGERFWESEVHRLRGALLRTGSDPAAAEESFQSGLDVARSQGARSLELRAATSLALLWVDTGRGSEAKSLLHETLGEFTEGLETADLRDALALRDSL